MKNVASWFHWDNRYFLHFVMVLKKCIFIVLFWKINEHKKKVWDQRLPYSWPTQEGLKYWLLLPNWKTFMFSGEQLSVKDSVKMPERGKCTRCGFVSSQEICKACSLLEGLNRGLPKLGIGKKSHADRIRKALAEFWNHFLAPSPEILMKSLYQQAVKKLWLRLESWKVLCRLLAT